MSKVFKSKFSEAIAPNSWHRLDEGSIDFLGSAEQHIPASLGYHLPAGEHECRAALLVRSRDTTVEGDEIDNETAVFWQSLCTLQERGIITLEVAINYRSEPFPAPTPQGGLQLARIDPDLSRLLVPPMLTWIRGSTAEQSVRLPDGTLCWEKGDIFLTFQLLLSIADSGLKEADSRISLALDQTARSLSLITRAPVFISCNAGLFYVHEQHPRRR